MKSAPDRARFAPAAYRFRLIGAMMALVSAACVLVLAYAGRRLGIEAEAAAQAQFQGLLDARHQAEAVRTAALVERCRVLARRPRIHAALEDDALDRLYPSAQDELIDLMAGPDSGSGDRLPGVLRAEFYRFLGDDGRVIPPMGGQSAGALAAGDEAALGLPAVPMRQEIGYLPLAGRRVAEVIATPIVSEDTGLVIAALVVGFPPDPRSAQVRDGEIQSGIWTRDALYPTRGSSESARAALASVLLRQTATPAVAPMRSRIEWDGAPALVFANRLNPGSAYPPAFEFSVFSLSELASSERRLRWEVVGIGLAVLAAALVATEFLARQWLAKPVERLAAESERSARFSADASHQLKTPVAVLRAGLEELLARDHLGPDDCEEISRLIHQTYRLSSLIEDLLLLSRMDAGRLKLQVGTVNLTRLIEGLLDDLGAAPTAERLDVEVRVAPALEVAGEERYIAIILQNLLENARKYNRKGGRVRVLAQPLAGEGVVVLAIGNTGAPIPADARAQIFERFHRAAAGEDLPGYGLGLNLARDLARLHGGELRLVSSGSDWTEFELRLPAATAVAAADGSE